MAANPEKDSRLQLEEYVESARNQRSRTTQELVKICERALDTIDFEEYERVKVHHMSEHSATLPNKYKYFDLHCYLKNKLRRVIALGLHESPPKKILDLGAGASHFGFICKLYGHEVLATDIEDGSFVGSERPGENPEGLNNGQDGETVYGDITRVLGIDRRIYRVEPFTPFPNFGYRFDLITGFMVCFNAYWVTEELWSAREWDFLISDLQTNQLRPGGEIFFQLNRSTIYKGMDIDSPELLDFVNSRGGSLDQQQCSIYFPPVGASAVCDNQF